jgi:hypothetical protein
MGAIPPLSNTLSFILFSCSLFNDAVSSSDDMASNGKMIGEWWIGKDWEGSGRVLNEVPSRHLSGGTDEHHEKSVMITGIPAEIRTEDLPDTSIGYYRYTSLLGSWYQKLSYPLRTTYTTNTLGCSGIGFEARETVIYLDGFLVFRKLQFPQTKFLWGRLSLYDVSDGSQKRNSWRNIISWKSWALLCITWSSAQLFGEVCRPGHHVALLGTLGEEDNNLQKYRTQK